MEWTDVSEKARDWMKEIGEFGPTVHAANREVKGRVADENNEFCKAYYTSDELRSLAAACTEVADWLDKRAAAAAPAVGAA